MSETITTLRLEDVLPNPKNNRDKLNGIEELAASIAENGQLTPIRVQRDGDTYWIIAGHRRHAALTLNGSPTVEAVIEDDIDDATTAKRIVADNACTETISELERSRGLQMMLATGVRPEAAAASCGISAYAARTVHRLMPTIQDYGEDMTLDRWLAAAEFEGDADALHAIETATEANWRVVVSQLQTARKMIDAVAAAEAIVAAAGCELLEQQVVQAYGAPYSYISMGVDAPAGARYATLFRRDWNGTVAIDWYKDAEAQAEGPDDNAKRAEADRLKAERKADHARRLEFCAGFVARDKTALKHLASDCWDNGRIDASSSSIDALLDGITGFTARVYAAIFSSLESEVSSLMLELGGYNERWRISRCGALTREYLAALVADGYELSPTEQDDAAYISEAMAAGDEDE